MNAIEIILVILTIAAEVLALLLAYKLGYSQGHREGAQRMDGIWKSCLRDYAKEEETAKDKPSPESHE